MNQDRRRKPGEPSSVWNDARRRIRTAQKSDPRNRAVSAERISPEEPLENGRVLAWCVLQECEDDRVFLQEALQAFEHRHQLSSSERALAVDVSSGVMRRRRTLDRLIESRLTRPRSNTEPELWQVLRIGAWQLLFSRTPAHAAVDTAVQLCRLLGRERWTGFVNGILRSIGRLISEQPEHGPTRHSIPGSPGEWIGLTADVLPDLRADLEDWFGDAFSLPSVLAKRWLRTFREVAPESTEDCHQDLPAALLNAGFWINQSPSTVLRVNLLRSTPAEVARQMMEHQVSCISGTNPEALWLDQAGRIEALPGFQEGLWSVQDESAMAASRLLNPQPGERILDLCAAPGGKTTHLAELSDDRAEILATDVSEKRLRRVIENASRLQLNSIRTLPVDSNCSSLPNDTFDAVLADVPCSNTGVLGRRPEARWRFSDEAQAELITMQTNLLQIAIARCRPGGRVVYSTCSVEPEENEGVVNAVLSQIQGVRLLQTQRHLPGSPSDGAFQALLARD